MSLVVAGIGLSGTAYVVSYLRERLTLHGIEHNRAIVASLQSLVRAELRPEEHTPAALQRFAHKYGAFGYRIFVLDGARGELIADSGAAGGLPKPIAASWVGSAAPLQEPGGDWQLQRGGAAIGMAEPGHPFLVWLAPLETGNASSHRWTIGVASDRKTLTSFLGDLHWHLDGVMVLTYLLIGLFGLFSVRGIGRSYERRLELQIRERTRALESAHAEMLRKARLATIGQTASVLAHEMRNPLASIKLALSGVKGSECLEERERRRVALVMGEVDRLDSLLHDTLEYVRPLRLSSEPVALDEVLTEVLHREEPVVSRRGLRIRRERCADCTAIPLDRDKLHQALLNLLKNAVEASPPGGEIAVRLYRERTEAVLEMANDGGPPSEETLARAFDPFFTTKPKGSGLGLGLVRQVIEEHGGTVTLGSDSLGRTRARVRLPMPC